MFNPQQIFSTNIKIYKNKNPDSPISQTEETQARLFKKIYIYILGFESDQDAYSIPQSQPVAQSWQRKYPQVKSTIQPCRRMNTVIN